MSIVKGLILTLIFLAFLWKIIILKKENKSQRDYFLKTLNHDFKVATIAQLRGLELIEQRNNDYDSELINEIKHSCKDSIDMISMLTNIYHFENNKDILNYEIFFIEDIFNENIFLIKDLLKEKNLELITNLSKPDLIQADRKLFTKLILMLFTTAVNYSENNNIIFISSKIHNEILEFSLAYRGKTLTEEECKRMFNKNPHFSTVGHGLKMNFCKKIIEFHHGKIFVKNFAKNLNSFNFIIPIKKSQRLEKNFILTNLQTN